MSRQLTLREFDKRKDEILARMREETKPFEEDTDKAREARIAATQNDRLKFGLTYMPHYFTRPFGAFHYSLNQRLDVQEQIVPFAGPRGSGKTVIAFTLCFTHEICHNIGNFKILSAHDADPHAYDQNKFIIQELKENQRIIQDFGNLVEGDPAPKDFETTNGQRLLTRSVGQDMKGLRHRQWRPDRIHITDFETRQSAKSPGQVKKGLSWLRGEVRGMFGVERGYHIFVEGQVIEKKCALDQLLTMKDDDENLVYPNGMRWAAEQPDGTSYWPEGMTWEHIQQIKRDMGSIEFERWYNNNPKDDEGMFREEWIRYYHPIEIQDIPLRVFGFADLSAKSGQEHDYKALIILGVDEHGIVYILDAYIRHCSPREFARALYNRWLEYNCVIIGAEENALHEWMEDVFNSVGREMKVSQRPRGVSHSTNKGYRIGALSSAIEHGTIRFLRNHPDQALLIEQLIYYPSSTVHDDGPDALSGAMEVKDEFNRKIGYQSLRKRRFAEMEGAY